MVITIALRALASPLVGRAGGIQGKRSTVREKGLVERFCVYSKAVGEPNRMKMIKILGSHDPESLNVSDIAEILGLSQPATTRHLKVMEAAGLFDRKRIGTNVYYSLNEDALQEYYELIGYAFEHAHTPCEYGYDCTKCPHVATCM